MAKRAAPRRRRSVVHRARSAIGRVGGGKLSPAIHGAIGGLAAQLGGRLLPGFGRPLALGGVGWYTGNQTLLTIAGMEASALIPIGGLLGGLGAGGNGGGAI